MRPHARLTIAATFHSLLLASILGLLLPGAALGHDYSKGSLLIDQPWSRATPRGTDIAAGYMAIENRGTAPERLIGVASEIASRVEVHEMTMTGGVMRMRPLANGLSIAAGKSVKLEPGGYHVMFVGLKRPLAQGDRFKATLQFERAGAVEVEFNVQAMGASGGHAPPGH
jgi:periplasmic copper chaperone A